MYIEGKIENIIYRNNENGYTVLRVFDGKTVFTLVGNLSVADKGQKICANVEEYNNEIYGLQYKILNYEIKLPDDEGAIIKYLSNKSFKGIGVKLAKKIVDEFGKNTINVILNEPEKLYNIKSLTDEKILTLRKVLNEKHNQVGIAIELEKLGLGQKNIQNIIDVYGDEALYVINDNPYELALNVDGVGFITCDNIARLKGFSEDSEKRIEALILYLLDDEYNKGSTFVYKEDLLSNAIKIANLNFDYNFDDILYNLQIELKIVIVNYDSKELVYLKVNYDIEKKLSEILYNKKDDIVIITGGPGTGKTYNIKKYIKNAEKKGDNIALAAPTGRAVKRITEVTNYEAKTIHRLLECIADSDSHKTYFSKNEDNPLECDVLIVDEMSMVDEHLMYSLMKATVDGTKIILVGDVDQLPSVGAGRVLNDMIASKIFKVKKLTKIHRQDDGSNIVICAHKVNKGEKIDLNENFDDLKFIHKNSEDKICDAIITLVKNNIPKYFNIDLEQIQVICPSKKGMCGTEALNVVIQNEVNPESYDKTEIKIGENILRLGDKVMQTTNNYNIPYDIVDSQGKIIDKSQGIFNGDIGNIVEIDENNRTLNIKFDNCIAYYDNKDIKDLVLAYAITAHKSQGSEYDVVIMPMTKVPYQLENRKILYTAMTRAKKCICFVGMEKYFNNMIINNKEQIRNSKLCSDLFIKNVSK